MRRADSSEYQEAAIAALEANRAALGDTATDAAIAALRGAIDDLRASPDREGEEERKLVTIMFADASGFTALSEKLGAEQVRMLMNGCFGVLVPVIERFGGTIDKFIGDCVMALFGAPVTREDDAQRCLGAALEMIDALEAFNRANGTAIGVHFGINTGEVIAGGIGGSSRQDYSVMGDAVNVAARLQDLAKSGEIFVGPETVRLARAHFEFESVATVQLKGREKLVAVHRLVGRRLERDEAAVGEIATTGRDGEVARILAALRDGIAGHPRRLMVSGEPGIGKTRLLAEARRGAGASAAFVVARAQSSTVRTPYGLIADTLMRLSESKVEQGSAKFGANLEQACRARAGDDADELFVPLALMAGVPVEPALSRQFQGIAPEALQQRFAAAFALFARGAVPASPLVLCFEDMHWADSATIGLVAQLSHVPNPPELVAMSARTEGLAALEAAGLGWDEAVQVLGLSSEDIGLLTRTALGAHTLGSNLFQLLNGRSEGNPFFLEQLISTLREADGIDLLDGVAELRPETIDVAMPASLHGLIQARLDQLSKPAKRTLQAAAAVGRTFPVRLIERLEELAGSTAEETGGRLHDLASRDLLRKRLAEASELAEHQYVFRHAAIQEVAYGTLLAARKKLIHGAIAETLETFFGEQSQEFSLTLAHHFRCAGEDHKAAGYFLDGADRAAAIYAIGEARTAYREALDALARCDPEMDAGSTRRSRIRGLTGLGEVCGRAGKHAAAELAFREALDLCSPVQDITAAGLHRKIGLSSMAQRLTTEAAHSFETALWMLGQPRRDNTPEWWSEWIEIQLERLWTAYFSGDLLAMQKVRDEALDLVERQGSLSQRSRFGKRVLLIVFREECLNISEATMASARESLALSQGLDDPDDLARAHFMVAFCAMWRGDMATAETHYPRALDLATVTGNAEYRVMTASYIAVMHRKRGDADRVAEWCDIAESLAQAARMPLYVSIAQANRAWLALRRGAYGEVEELAAPIVAAWKKSPWQLAWLAAWPLLAARLDRGGQGDLAMPVEALCRANQQRQGPTIDEPLGDAARLIEEGRTAEAVMRLKIARSAAAALGCC